MPKTDHYNDPSAPEANSIVVAVAAAVQDSQGRLLLIKRSDNSLWALPGGAQDIGETVTQAAEREVREETGVKVDVINLSGIYSDPNHVIAYDDGEVRQDFSLCFRAKPIGGTLSTSIESSQVRWVHLSELEALDIHPTMRLRIDHATESPNGTYLG